MPVVGLLLAASAGVAQEQASRAPADPDQPAILDCGAPAAPPLSCVFRAPPLATIEAISAKGAETDRRLTPAFQPFTNEAARTLGYREAVLLLIDATSGLSNGRRSTLGQTQHLAEEIVRQTPTSAVLAVAAFGTDLRLLADFRSARSDVLRAIDDIWFDEVNTRLYAALLRGIGLVRDQEATIGRVILLSDGLPEDDRGVNERKVLKAAVDAGVSISTMALYWHPSGSELNGLGSDVMRTLAEGTLGVFDDVVVQSQPIDASGFLGRLRQQRENSGFLLVSDAPLLTRVSVRVEAPTPGPPGQIDTQTFTAFLENPDAGPPAPPPEPPIPEPTRPAWLILAGIGGIVLLAILSLLLFRRVRRRHAEHGLDSLTTGADAPAPSDSAADSDGATRYVRRPQSDKPAIAYIYRADVSADPFVVRGSRVSIGRSGDNDLIIAHDSVSRVHAEVHRTRDGVFSIRDTGSLNKVRVNGEEVDNADLRHGDLIQLGETRLRFEYAQKEPEHP